jgi:hypothetical protein
VAQHLRRFNSLLRRKNHAEHERKANSDITNAPPKARR